jgi:hypothetical protein
VVHVTVSAGPGWVAVAALVLSVAAILWQAYTFKRSGSRVQVKARFAMPLVGYDASGRPPTFTFPDDALLAAAVPSHQLRQLPMVAVIQNTGRQAVTVRHCTWHTAHVTIQAVPSVGQEFPCRLEADDECMSAILPDLIGSLIGASAHAVDSDADSEQMIWPQVELGNGRTKRGNSLVLPALISSQQVDG